MTAVIRSPLQAQTQTVSLSQLKNNPFLWEALLKMQKDSLFNDYYLTGKTPR
jgi:hypothetical protein